MQLSYVLVGAGGPAAAGSDDVVMSDIDFGTILREGRKKLGLTQGDVSARAGIALMTYGRIERGDVQPKLEQVRRIFSVLGLNLDAIEEQVEERLTASECLNKIEFYVGELRKVLGR